MDARAAGMKKAFEQFARLQDPELARKFLEIARSASISTTVSTLLGAAANLIVEETEDPVEAQLVLEGMATSFTMFGIFLHSIKDDEDEEDEDDDQDHT